MCQRPAGQRIRTLNGRKWSKVTTDINSANNVYSASIYQSIVDGKADAKVNSKTEKIDGKDAYKVDVVLNGDVLEEALKSVSTTGENIFSSSR